MENEIYRDPILQKYIALIESKTRRFKRIYFGDPVRIGVSELPALIIAKIDTTIKNLSNVEDLHEVRLSFTVVTDIRETINDDKTMVAGVNSLYNLIEGRNANYTLQTESLMGILRHNVEIDTVNNLRTDLNTMSRVDYAMTMGKRQPGAWAIEGVVDVMANFTQIR